MAVNFPKIDPDSLHPVAGMTLGWAEAHIRKPGRKDVLVIALEEGASVAGVFTLNRFCAAPVTVCREHLARTHVTTGTASSVAGAAAGAAAGAVAGTVAGTVAGAAAPAGIRALVVNTGNANAGTGEPGLAVARQTCVALADLMGIAPEQVLPFSTGVILEPLPVDRLIAGLPAALSAQAANHWYQAAEAIMTTDTVPKAASRELTIDGHRVVLTGISKGAGMIRPNMATMLGFIGTDAGLSPSLLQALVKEVADRSFNCITIDGDTSTNDSFIVAATGRSTLPMMTSQADPAYPALRNALIGLAQEIAQLIIRDGEGATKFITIKVEGGQNAAECRKVGYAIGHSPLVKTAFFASDPNLGRILAAIGYAGIDDLDVGRVDLYLDDVQVARAGGRNPDYQEADGQRVMQKSEIEVRVVLGRGDAEATIWTCDLSHDYVSINADYRS